VDNNVLAGHPAALAGAAQTGGAEQCHALGSETRAGSAGGQRLDVPGGIAGFLQQLAPGRFGASFARASMFVPNDPGGKLNCAGVNRDAVLLHQQDFLFRSHRKNDGGAGGVDSVHVFPMAFFDQGQELAGMEGSWSVVVHLNINQDECFHISLIRRANLSVPQSQSRPASRN